MDIQEYYRSGRYAQETSAWRSQEYFPRRVKWMLKHLPEQLRGSVLDAGCGDGTMLEYLKVVAPTITCYGTDVSQEPLALARERGIETTLADANQALPFTDAQFHFVFAHEVVEHLVDPDQLFIESSRVLKPGGYLLVTTPNLSAWYNRVFALFGYPSITGELSTRDRRVGLGLLRKVVTTEQPVGHIRIFNLRALRDLAAAAGLTPVAVSGDAVAYALPWWLRPIYATLDYLFSLIPTLSSNILIIAQKPHAAAKDHVAQG